MCSKFIHTSVVLNSTLTCQSESCTLLCKKVCSFATHQGRECTVGLTMELSRTVPEINEFSVENRKFLLPSRICRRGVPCGIL